MLYNDNMVHMIDQEYLVLLSNKSITFQTMDASWEEDEELDEMKSFLKNKLRRKETENILEELEDYLYE